MIVAAPMRPAPQSLGDGPLTAALDPDLAARSTDPALRSLIDGLADAGRSLRPVVLIGESGVGKGYFARRIHRLRRGSDSGLHVVFAVGLNAIRLQALLDRARPSDSRPMSRAAYPAVGPATVVIRNVELLEGAARRLLREWLCSAEVDGVRRVGLIATAEPIGESDWTAVSPADSSRPRPQVVHRLGVPAVRARTQDRIVLATDLLRTVARELDRPIPSLSLEGWRCVMQRSWRGNVRELANALRQEMLMSDPQRPLNLGRDLAW